MNKRAHMNFSSAEESLLEVCLSLIVSILQLWTKWAPGRGRLPRVLLRAGGGGGKEENGGGGREGGDAASGLLSSCRAKWEGLQLKKNFFFF